jgi:hypothetical protein
MAWRGAKMWLGHQLHFVGGVRRHGWEDEIQLAKASVVNFHNLSTAFGLPLCATQCAV